MALILVVDDLAAHRAGLVAILGGQGHRVVEAADGSAGLAAVLAERPDLVVTDVLMPVMDGFEFVRRLRSDPASNGIPVLFYTAPYSEHEARALAAASGRSQVVAKSAKPEEVLSIVGRLLAGNMEPAAPDESAAAARSSPAQLRLLSDKLSERAGALRAANARLRAMINIGLELASSHDPERLLSSVCSDTRDMFGASYVTVGLVDSGDLTMRAVISCGADADWIKPGEAVPGVLGAVVAERRTLRRENPGGKPAGFQLPANHPEVQTFLAAPIASAAHVYGWICLVCNEGRAFTEDDEDLITALAGQVGQIYELEHEIAERRHAEAALRLERDRSQRYLDTAEAILLALDLEGRITLVNRYACAVFGWTAEELLGRDFIETCIPAGIRKQTRARFSAVLTGPDSSIITNPILTRAGEVRLVEWRNTVLRDDAGQVTATISSGTDITERTGAIEALRVGEERMRFALDSANVGIWDQEYASGVLKWSATLEAQYGFAPGTFGGTFEAFVERIHPDDRDAVLETLGKAMKSGEDFSIQNRALWHDGTVRWLSGRGRIRLDAEGQPVRGLGISMDITEQHSLEMQYQQAQKMEAIGRLAGGVAHDFNNLLTGILGYCELLLVDLAPDDPRMADIGEIQKAGLSAAGLTRQLLAFSRKQIIEPTLLDLNVTVTRLRPILSRLIGEDVKIVLALRPDLALIKADRGQIEQIIMNLAINSRDAMPAGGILTIETANVELDEDYPTTHLGGKPGAFVVLTVADTGTGMTREVQSRLFEPFFTTKDVGKGTGLGLATVHGIVEQCGGSVNVYSEVGRGTLLKVYFPRAEGEELLPVAPLPIEGPITGTQTVLVVEDSDALRELTRRLLERQGYTVLAAAHAEEAVRLFNEHATIDLVLTDVVMPGASGPELTRRLVEQRPGLKVVYMSGYSEETIVQHGVLNPGIAFLHKPFTSESLGRKIREVLDRQPAI